MRDFGVSFERVPLMCDNTSAISVAKNTVLHKRMRHLQSETKEGAKLEDLKI
jgi:hypothetical protein